MSNLPILQFSNPIFKNGINLTVRKGSKWLGVTELQVDAGDGRLIRPKYVATLLMPFNAITDHLLSLEHDPECREYSKLLAVMVELYPDFVETDEVTLVLFTMNMHKPEIGDHVHKMDMDWMWKGTVTDAIPLDFNRWEIHFESPDNLGTLIVHESDWIPKLFNGDNIGSWVYP